MCPIISHVNVYDVYTDTAIDISNAFVILDYPVYWMFEPRSDGGPHLTVCKDSAGPPSFRAEVRPQNGMEDPT
jgi:hypothetical protein